MRSGQARPRPTRLLRARGASPIGAHIAMDGDAAAAPGKSARRRLRSTAAGVASGRDPAIVRFALEPVKVRCVTPCGTNVSLATRGMARPATPQVQKRALPTPVPMAPVRRTERQGMRSRTARPKMTDRSVTRSWTAPARAMHRQRTQARMAAARPLPKLGTQVSTGPCGPMDRRRSLPQMAAARPTPQRGTQLRTAATKQMARPVKPAGTAAARQTARPRTRLAMVPAPRTSRQMMPQRRRAQRSAAIGESCSTCLRGRQPQRQGPPGTPRKHQAKPATSGSPRDPRLAYLESIHFGGMGKGL